MEILYLMICNWTISRRKAKLQRIANQIGCEFYMNSKGSYFEKWITSFPTLNEPFGVKKITNIMQGRYLTFKLLFFDYSFRHREPVGIIRKFTAAIVENKTNSLPYFQLWPKKHVAWNPTAMTRKQLQNERFNYLSDEYILLGDKKEDIKNIFNDTIMKEFRRYNGWSIEGHGSLLMIYREDEIVRTEGLMKFFYNIVEINNLFMGNHSA